MVAMVAKIKFRRLSRGHSLRHSGVIAKGFLTSLNAYSRDPLIVAGVPTNTGITAAAICADFCISSVIGRGDNTEICEPVVGATTVYVVYLPLWPRAMV